MIFSLGKFVDLCLYNGDLFLILELVGVESYFDRILLGSKRLLK